MRLVNSENTTVLTIHSDDIAYLSADPLVGFVESRDGELTAVEQAGEPFDQLLIFMLCEPLTDHDPRSPFTIIGIGPNKQQGHKLNSEDDSSKIEHDSTDCEY